jgi:hypothetical protein
VKLQTTNLKNINGQIAFNLERIQRPPARTVAGLAAATSVTCWCGISSSILGNAIS